MKGRICLVTGATSGIGRAMCVALAELGAEVLGVGRDPARSAATEAEIRSQTANRSVRFLTADLSSQSEVWRLAREVASDRDRLDVLVNNAGAMYERRRLTADGLEMTFALNHLAPFLLTSSLLGLLRSSGDARVITTSSEAHAGVELDFDDLAGGRAYSRHGWREYRRSKLANLLFTSELARRLNGSAVTAHAFHPGLVATEFARSAGLGVVRRAWLRLRSVDAAKGADTAVYLATSADVVHRTGRYWIDRQPVDPSPAALSREAATRLWIRSAELTGLTTSLDARAVGR